MASHGYPFRVSCESSGGVIIEPSGNGCTP